MFFINKVKETNTCRKSHLHTVCDFSVDICDIICVVTLKVRSYVTWFNYKRNKAFQILYSHLHQKKHETTVSVVMCPSGI